jgi:hypothetical protein
MGLGNPRVPSYQPFSRRHFEGAKKIELGNLAPQRDLTFVTDTSIGSLVSLGVIPRIVVR